MSNFDHVWDRRNTNSAKWDKYLDTDIIPMWVADMDFRIPEEIVTAIKDRADHAIFGYDMPPRELKGVIVERMKTLYDWHVDARDISYLSGVVPGLNQACRGLVGEGEAVVTATPIYYPFLSAPENWGRKLHRIRTESRGDTWPFPLEKLARTAAEHPEIRLLLLCNPYNPVGRLLTREELGGIVDICHEHDIIICSDEIHCELVLDGREHIPTAALGAKAEEITITLMAPTKTFNIAGLGGAVVITRNEALRERFKFAGRGMMNRLSTFGFLSMLVAWRDGEPWRHELLSYLAANRDYLADRIAAMPGVSMSPVEATYLAWLDVSGLKLNDAQGFFESAGVGLSDGGQFDGEGYMRLNFACPRETLANACDRMEKALVAHTGGTG